jgi:hypothetical protein
LDEIYNLTILQALDFFKEINKFDNKDQKNLIISTMLGSRGDPKEVDKILGKLGT